jgi:heme/copper-type cytochrome/quinol oxidase subunit 2
MKPWIRWAVLAASAVVVVVLFVALRPEPASDDASRTLSATVSPTPSETSSPTPSATATASPEPEAVEIEVEVEEGRVEGPDRPRIRQGERVVLVVKSDVADEVHVHGYDLSAEVAPGQPARVRFRANVAGVFEVELEHTGLLLLELEITP